MFNKTILLLTTLFLLLLAGCTKDNRKPPVISSGLAAGEIPQQQIWGMRVLKTDSSRVDYRMYATYARGIGGGGFNGYSSLEVDSGLTVIFYKKGRTFGRLESRRGTMDQRNEIFVARDSVVLKSPAGWTVYTEMLTLNHLEKRIYTDLPVMSVRDLDTLWGDGFVSSENMEEYNLHNPRGKAYLPGDELKKAGEN